MDKCRRTCVSNCRRAIWSTRCGSPSRPLEGGGSFLLLSELGDIGQFVLTLLIAGVERQAAAVVRLRLVELSLLRQAHLRQFEILTCYFTATFRAGKATGHYNTVNVRILEFARRSTAHYAAGTPLPRIRRGFAWARGPRVGSKSLCPRKEMLRLPTRHPHKIVAMD